MSKWKGNWIYWHEVIAVDKTRDTNNHKVGQIQGMEKKTTGYETFDEKAMDITPYVSFRYLGRTEHTGDTKKDFEEWKKLKDKLHKKTERSNTNG